MLVLDKHTKLLFHISFISSWKYFTLFENVIFMGSSQFVLNQLGLIPLSPDPFCPFSTGPCFIGPLEFCPLVSSSCFISDSCYFVLDQIVLLSVRPLEISCFFFSYSVIFVLFQIALCYFVPNPNRPLPLRS